MVGAFRTDTPSESEAGAAGSGKNVIGLRMPYSMPLQKYGRDEIPWVATEVHTEPDSLGRVYGL